MATAKTKIGITLTLDNSATVTIYEGDLLSGVTYKDGSTTKFIENATVRVINAITRNNTNVSNMCPPEPYVSKYVLSSSIVLDDSAKFDANIITVPISNIYNINRVNDDVIAVSVNGKPYPSLSSAIHDATDGERIDVLVDIVEPDIVIPAGANVVIYGNGNTITGGISFDSSSSDVSLTIKDAIMDGKIPMPSFDGDDPNSIEEIIEMHNNDPYAHKNIIIDCNDDISPIKSIDSSSNFNDHINNPYAHKNIIIDGNDYGKASAIISNNIKNNLNLVLDGVTFNNYQEHGVIINNGKYMKISNCIFNNTVTVGTKHSVDINLINVQDSTIVIENTIFKGTCGLDSPIVIAQRGGLSDANNPDIPDDALEATIASAIILGCSFEPVDSPAHVTIGSVTYEDNDGENTTANFPVTIEECKTNVIISPEYLGKDADDLVVEIGQRAIKEPDGDFIIE